MKHDTLRFGYLQLFAEGAGSGGDGGDSGGDGSGEGGAKDIKSGKVEFTPEQQAEIDRMVSDRLARQAKKYADYDDLKTKVTTFEQAEEDRLKAAMSEKDRLEAEKAEALKKAEEAEGKAQSTLDAANKRMIKAEFRALARELGVRADALDDAFVLADLTAVTVDDDGNIDGVQGAVEALLKAKPYLVAEAKTKPKTIGEPSNPTQDEIKTLEQQLAEAQKKKDFSKVVELSNKIKGLTKQ
ncbi:scaffolding protein [Paenibacillus elgii]|uniref:phage scaffolding protein n=1 Tax=Paenibacillus elgii TaxID=189691 RepID=UPI001112B27C|nr:scaffolding protein [Paenibacillus elgii]